MYLAVNVNAPNDNRSSTYKLTNNCLLPITLREVPKVL